MTGHEMYEDTSDKRVQVDQLLDEWEELRESNPNLSLAVFVKDRLDGVDSELVAAFRDQAEELSSIDQQMEQVAGPLPTVDQTPKWDGDALQLSALEPGLEPIPGYKLASRLGGGGFGEVWKAESPGGFHVALKFVQIGGRVGEVEERSLEVIKDVRHPHLLSVFGTWRIGDLLIIATELADRTLLDRLHEAQKEGHDGIPKDELLVYLAEAAKGIDFLNDPGKSGRMRIQHRDIKPQNLLLSGGSVKVGDFGLARSLQYDVASHTGSLTFAYAAPECFDGTTSNRSDQYSLAVTFCHLRGGRLPFEGNPIAVMNGHRRGIPDLSMLPVAERCFVAKALAKVPKDRWTSCREFVLVLMKAAGVNANIHGLLTPDIPYPPLVAPPIQPLPAGCQSQAATSDTSPMTAAIHVDTQVVNTTATDYFRRLQAKRSPVSILLLVSLALAFGVVAAIIVHHRSSVQESEEAKNVVKSEKSPHGKSAVRDTKKITEEISNVPVASLTPPLKSPQVVERDDLNSDASSEPSALPTPPQRNEATNLSGRPQDEKSGFSEAEIEWEPALTDSTYCALFRDLPLDGSVLVGIELTTGRYGRGFAYEAVASITPIYETKTEERRVGRPYGNAGSNKKQFIEDGYAIGAIKLAFSSERLVGMQIHFMRFSDGRLDPADAHWSEPYLRQENSIVVGDGRVIVGICGRYCKQEMREFAIARFKQP